MRCSDEVRKTGGSSSHDSGKQRVKDNIDAYLAKLHESWEELPPVFLTSSEHRIGKDEILDYIDKINKSL